MDIIILLFAISSSIVAVVTFKKSVYYATRELIDNRNLMTRYWFIGVAGACFSLAAFCVSLGIALGTLAWLLMIGSHLTAIVSLPLFLQIKYRLKSTVKQSTTISTSDSSLFDDLVV